MSDPQPWTCAHCQVIQTHETRCVTCERPRYASWAIQVAEHVTEHLADGVSEPLSVLKAMQDRQCYAKAGLTLQFIASQMRLLTTDTTALARQIAKARASRVMLDVLETGDAKDKIAVLKGIQVLGDVVEHTGSVSTTVTHVYESAGPREKKDEIY